MRQLTPTDETPWKKQSEVVDDHTQLMDLFLKKCGPLQATKLGGPLQVKPFHFLKSLEDSGSKKERSHWSLWVNSPALVKSKNVSKTCGF